MPGLANQTKKRLDSRSRFPQLVSSFLSCYDFLGRLHANWNRQVGWRAEVRATSPSGHAITVDSDRRQTTRLPHGTGVARARRLHRHRHRHHSGKETAEAGIPGSDLFGERATKPPTVWTKLELLYRLGGPLDDAAVKHAIQLSEEKYCSVAAMLRKQRRFPGATKFFPSFLSYGTFAQPRYRGIQRNNTDTTLHLRKAAVDAI